MAGLPVYTPDLVSGLALVDEATNLATAARKIDLSARPASSVTVQAINMGSSTVKVVYVVLNAASDAEAAVKLATAGQRQVVVMGGGALTLTFATPVSRIDIVGNAAESGANLVVTTAIGG